MNQSEELVLPDTASGLWQTTREITRRGIKELTGRSSSYAIGGGTILAARWKHRSSDDIDIVVAEDTAPGAVLGGSQSRFKQEIEELGAIVRRKARGRLVSAEWTDRKIDVWATTPIPRIGAGTAAVDGRLETVLSTTQILRGKLERGEDCLARDVYDLLQAKTRDRKSLVAAANDAGRHWTLTIAGIWEAANTRIGNRAATLNTTAALERPRQLGNDAAETLRKAIYTRLEIGVERNRIVVKATTGFGDEEPIIITGSTNAAFEQLGLSGYLANQGHRAQKIGKEAEEARKKGGEYTPIYAEEESRSTLQTSPAARLAARGAPARPQPLRAWRQAQKQAAERKRRR